MKRTLAILLAMSAVGSGLSGCGDDVTTTGAEGGPGRAGTSDGGGRFAVITNRSGSSEPTLHPSAQPPPRKVLIRDLEKGTGPVARKGDRVAVFYIGVDYRTGESTFFRWPPEEPFSLSLGADHWEKAIVGMRAGGRREVIIPSHLRFGEGTLDYLFKLVSVNGRGPSGG